MKLFLTSGTPEFMESMRKRYPKETMVAMHGTGNSVLLHETAGKTVFQTPRRYEVISSSGNLTEQGFFVFNNIPVTDEGRPVFEHRFMNRAGAIDDEPGFIAFRLLRPLDSDTYIVMTQWSKSLFFDTWKNSSTYQMAHEQKDSHVGTDKTIHIFSSAPYVTTFTTKKDEEETH